MSQIPALSLVLGGARSGKSALAERLVVGTGLRRIFVATAEAGDDEMRTRIAAHRAQRGAGWTTREAPLDLAGTLARSRPGQVVLVDCLTLWLGNLLLAGRDADRETAILAKTLHRMKGPVVLVSGETGWGIVPATPLARRFRDEQGRLNQRMAAQADLVIGVMAGLPLVLKGQLPEGAA